MKTSYSRRELYAAGEPIGDGATKKLHGRVVYGDGGGGGSSQPSSTTQTSDLPDWAKPYAKEVLGKGSALSDAPYQAYQGERQAQFTPMQQQAFQGARGMQPSATTGLGAATAALASERALGTGYQERGFQNQFQAPGQYSPSQFQNPFQAPATYQQKQIENQFQAPGQYQAGQFSAGSVQGPQLQQYGMGPAERVGTQSFAQPGSAEAYMSPYMQNVVEKQQREAQRAADIAGTQRGAQAVSQGAFGGSRQAIMEAEAARNLAQQKGDIQATGTQAAYQQAQQQFNAEQQARLQAQMANQQAGLTTGQQNLAAQLGVQQLGATTGMQAQLANQQYGLSAQQLAEQSRQFGAGQGLSAAQLQAQYGMSAEQAQAAERQFGAQQGLSAAQLQAQYGMSTQQAQEAAKQFAAQQAMTGAQTGAQYGQAAQQLGEQSRQYGAGLGLQGLQTALTGAGQLGTLGAQQFGQGMDINKLQQAYGTQQQQQVQTGLSQQYEDFLAQKKFPYQQLEFQSNLLRGTPSGSTQTMYTAAPSAVSQVAGLGTAAYGASRLMAGGGVTRGYASGGLMDLAIADMMGDQA